MNRTLTSCRLVLLTLPALCLVLGCEGDVSSPNNATAKDKPPTASANPQGKKVPIGGEKSNVFLEVLPGDKRRVLIQASVCRRQDQLEQLLCRKLTKEHEAILHADIDARHVHAALLLARAKPGSPVQFQPRYQPAHGTKIKVYLRYLDRGKEMTVPAQTWIRHIKTKKDMEYDWIFAGSREIPNPFEKDRPPHYAANDGDVICISNFDTALLDVPVNLPNENANLLFEANTPRIPPENTPVTVILEPVLK